MNDKHRRHATILDWIREYRQLRRRDLPSEEALQKYQRVLFRVSGYVKWRGWTREQLEEALGIVATEPLPKPLKTKPKVPKVKRAATTARRGYGSPWLGIGVRKESLLALESAPIFGIRKQKIPRVHCKDCGRLLPAGRRCGRCDVCKRINARESKRKWWHKQLRDGRTR